MFRLRVLPQKEGKAYRLHRIGFCAVDFDQSDGSTQSIDRFFATKPLPDGDSVPATVERSKDESSESCMKKLGSNMDENDVLKSDMEFAKRLQSSYDKEHQALSILEQRKRKRSSNKVPTIDTFFRKR